MSPRATGSSRIGRRFPRFLHPPQYTLSRNSTEGEIPADLSKTPFRMRGDRATGPLTQTCNTIFEKWKFPSVWPRIFPQQHPKLSGLKEENMPKYVIERDIPGIGNVTPQEVIAISQKSCSVLKNLGPQIQWVHSYVTGDKIYCVYIAPNEEMVREHAKQGGFPVNRVSEVKLVIDPTSAEA